MTGTATDTARRIAAYCHTIALLHPVAELIADKQASMNRGDGKGGGRYHRPPDPIDDTATQWLSDIAQWLLDTSTALGLPRDKGMDMTSTHPERLAQWIADNAHALAAMPDARLYELDAHHCATLIRRICHEQDQTDTRWRAAHIPWQPQVIAGLLTQLTGHPVTAHRIRQAAHTGRITITQGTVILGQAATAIGM